MSAKLPRRFYESVRVVTRNLLKESSACKPSPAFDVFNNSSDPATSKCYEIELDTRPLRTQAGQRLTLHSLPLALAIAQEWRAQRESIDRARMRLTGLAFTAVDNPLTDTKKSLAEKILDFVETDTLLYFAGGDETGGGRLLDVQQAKWAPIIRWVNKRHEIGLLATQNVADMPTVPDESRIRLERWLLAHNFAALTGLLYGTESLKSLLVVMATVGHRLTVEEGVELARLEQTFQTDTWGNVEWCHDIEHLELSSRLAASVLFVNLCSNVHETDEISSHAVPQEAQAA